MGVNCFFLKCTSLPQNETGTKAFQLLRKADLKTTTTTTKHKQKQKEKKKRKEKRRKEKNKTRRHIYDWRKLSSSFQGWTCVPRKRAKNRRKCLLIAV